MAFNHKHLIDITEYSEEDIKLILETAKAFSEVNEHPQLFRARREASFGRQP